MRQLRRLLLCAAILVAFSHAQIIIIAKKKVVGCSLTYTTGLSAWYKADVGLTCTSGCTSGNDVTAWADQSGNANNLTSVNNPTYQASQINSLPSVRFVAGALDYMTLGTALRCDSGGPGACTIFVVSKLTTTGSSGVTIIAGATGSFVYWSDKGGTKQQGADRAAQAQLLAGTAGANTSWHQMNIKYVDGAGSGTIAARLDRAADGSASSLSALGTAGMASVGRNDVSGGTQYYDGDIAELLIYQAGLASGDIDTVEAYLNCRYGI